MNVNTNVPAWACPYCEMNMGSRAGLELHLSGTHGVKRGDKPPVVVEDFEYESGDTDAVVRQWVREEPLTQEEYRKIFPRTSEPTSPMVPTVADVTFEDVFEDIFDEALDLLIERQRKYGPENIEGQGIFGVFTRMRDDKMSRIANALHGTVEHGRVIVDVDDSADAADTFEDACIDIANYALIMLALYRGLWGAPLAEESK